MAVAHWPALVLDDGVFAGVGPGDPIALPTEDYAWVTRSPQGLDIAWTVNMFDEVVRFSDTSARVEQARGGAWVPTDADARTRVHFLCDAPALCTVRRFGGRLLTRPTEFSSALRLGRRVQHARFIDVRADGTLGGALCEWADGRLLHIHDEPFLSGVSPEHLLQKLGAPLDDAMAKTIAVQPRFPAPVLIGFDGVVLSKFASRARTWMAPWLLFRFLVGARALPQAEAERRMQAAIAAPVAEVGALVRAADPHAWERDQLIREECNVLAGLPPPPDELK